ncbi:cellulase family glycosylhydrolase [Microbacterium sp. CIAB417]|uniref:cellulase family glycosylhydrolase n=1 Tax=Microbacterium sp. CIAB417 TaxID=2860287 RepID=UPI001FAC70D8|nr:cellulase family glycosylhydrolase [Microbacterium sp. CIAB417]
MRRVIALMIGVLIALVGIPAAAQAASPGFSVSGGKIYDANGARFIPQGINHAHTWYPDELDSLAAIRAAGANTVRVVLSGGRWGTSENASEVAAIIAECKANQLVCILEYHDTTGYGEDSGATSLATAVQYWKSVKSAVVGQEKYVMINIGNEPFGNSSYSGWTSATISAIQALRADGFTHTLVVDAPNWGQDWSNTMRDNAPSVAAADSNVVFSVHMYGVYDTAAEVRSYLDAFTSRGLAVIVGEFGDNHSDGNPDEATIMSYTRSQGIGMLGWSWSGNGSGVEYLDMVNGFNASSLTAWGQRFINGADGLKARSPQVATVYSGDPGTEPGTDPGSDPGTEPGTAPNGFPYCVSASSDPDGDGWGWEQSRSCVVHGSAADTGTQPSTAPNGYPYCASASSDPDGDDWGWEQSRSCVVRGSAADR